MVAATVTVFTSLSGYSDVWTKCGRGCRARPRCPACSLAEERKADRHPLSPLMNMMWVKPALDSEDATSLTTATNVAGLKVTVPGKDSWWWLMP